MHSKKCPKTPRAPWIRLQEVSEIPLGFSPMISLTQTYETASAVQKGEQTLHWVQLESSEKFGVICMSDGLGVAL